MQAAQNTIRGNFNGTPFEGKIAATEKNSETTPVAIIKAKKRILSDECRKYLDDEAREKNSDDSSDDAEEEDDFARQFV